MTEKQEILCRKIFELFKCSMSLSNKLAQFRTYRKPSDFGASLLIMGGKI